MGEFNLYNPDGLIGYLNTIISEREGEILLGDFRHNEPRNTPLNHKLDDREIGQRGKFPIVQSAYSEFLEPLGIESENVIGYIHMESGFSEAYPDGGIYEKINFKLHSSLQLSDGQTIPRCNIKMAKKDGNIDFRSRARKDHKLIFRIRGPETDLTDVLPTEYFLAKND